MIGFFVHTCFLKLVVSLEHVDVWTLCQRRHPLCQGEHVSVIIIEHVSVIIILSFFLNIYYYYDLFQYFIKSVGLLTQCHLDYDNIHFCIVVNVKLCKSSPLLRQNSIGSRKQHLSKNYYSIPKITIASKKNGVKNSNQLIAQCCSLSI